MILAHCFLVFLRASRAFLVPRFIMANDPYVNRHQSVSSLLQPLNDLLSSERPNDSVSEEVVEMLGFDAIELVVDILNDRHSLSREVIVLLPDPRVPLLMLLMWRSLRTCNVEVVRNQDLQVRRQQPCARRIVTKLVPGHDSSLDADAARRRMEETLRANAARPLFSGTAVCLTFEPHKHL